MRILFDGAVTVNGRRVESLDLAEGERVLCQMVADRVYVAEIRIHLGQVVCRDLEVERWEGCAVLRPKFDLALSKTVRQQTREIGGVTYTVTAVCEMDHTDLWIDGLGSRLYVLPRGDNADVRFVEELSAICVSVRRGERQYLLLLSLYEDEVLYEGWVDGYRVGDRLMVICTYDDMKRHTRHRVFGYIDGRFGLIEQSFTCASAHTYIPMLVPYLFAEALAVGDEDEAKGYLSEELRADFEALKQYVGCVKRVCRPPLSTVETSVGVVDEAGSGRVLAFEMEGDEIVDVSVLDGEE